MSIRRRPVRLATVSHRPAAGVLDPAHRDRFLDAATAHLRRAAKLGADLVAFPEVYPQLALADPWHHAEPAQSGTLDRVRELARSLKLVVVWPRLEYEPERGVRNTAVLVNRDGEVVGRYDKMFPTVGEMEKGVVPGTECPVFETDLGRVGMLICFDLNFPEVREALAKGRPDVVVFPSMYRGGLQAQALAFELGAFVVTAISSELGLVIDRCGRVVKEATYEALAVAPVNTNSVAVHMDFNRDRIDRMLERFGRDLTIDFHTREAFVVVEYAGDHDMDDLIKEYGLETATAYWARARGARQQALEKFRASRPKVS